MTGATCSISTPPFPAWTPRRAGAALRNCWRLVGLDQWGHVRVGKYSKGMLQRVGLAQALMHSPTLLILDEPSDGVDPIGRRQIRDILHGLEQQGVTIFLNSHLLVEVELFCREVAIIHKGKLALQGSVKELTARKRLSPGSGEGAGKTRR